MDCAFTSALPYLWNTTKSQLIITVPQETKDMYKSAQAARNRRLGLIMLSVAFVFFMGIVMKRVMLG